MTDKPRRHQRNRKNAQDAEAWVCPLYDCPLTEPVVGTWADMQEHFRTVHPDYTGRVLAHKL